MDAAHPEYASLVGMVERCRMAANRTAEVADACGEGELGGGD
jgi:hypothetical protein